MKKLILVLTLMFCLIFFGTALGFEKVDVSGFNFSSTTVFVAKIQTFLDHGLGSSTTAVALVDDEPVLTVYATSDQTSGTVQSAVISLVVGGAGTIVEGLHVVVSTEYMSGSWINAVVGKLDFGTTGSAGGGMAAPLMSELNMQAAPSSGGSYYNVHSYFNVPTSATLIDSTSFNYAFEKYELAGGAATQFDQYGLLWHIVGLTDATTKVFYENTLKIQIDTTKWYIPLSSAEGTYTAATPIYIDSTLADPNIADGSAFGSQIESTMTGTSTGMFSASSSWANVNGITGANWVNAFTTGIWENAGDAGDIANGVLVFGMRMQAILTNTDFDRLVPFALNASGSTVSALFSVGNTNLGGDVGYVEATTQSDNPIGYVPLLIDSSGTKHWVRVYADQD